MSCLGECWDIGPPPDSILNLPPPPVPIFLQHPLPDLISNTTPCSSYQLCDLWQPSNKISDGSDYMEMPRKDIETWSVTGIDDTWLLVLVASSIGVLLLGALLAMCLLKCREISFFDGNECSIYTHRDHRQIKNHEPRECASVQNLNGNKLVHPSENITFHGMPNMQDNRMVWAAITPHGTQHFISQNYPRNLINYENDDHYETVDHLNVHQPETHPPSSTAAHYNSYRKGLRLKVVANEKSSFDNSGFIDYDYEDPVPLIETYQLNDLMDNCETAPQYSVIGGGNTDMRCTNLGMTGTIRHGISVRPRVSSPTRIEHPNLPPLNLYPHKSSTLKRNNLTYRTIDSSTGTLHKYGC